MTQTEDRVSDKLEEHQTSDPRIEYTRRREARLAEATRQSRRFRKVGVLRLASLAVGLVLIWLAVFNGLSLWWLLPPAIVFLVLAEVQGRISQGRRRCERAAALYDLALDRLDDRWSGKGASGERFFDAAHPYTADLDLFGPGSLFELLSRARTRAGEETLADWLLHPARPDVVRARQAAV